MPPTRTADEPAGGAVKKRRSFFSSNLPLPPKLPTPSASRLPVVPRAQVLAALSAPEEAALYRSRSRREIKQRVLASDQGSKTPDTDAKPEQGAPSGSRTTITIPRSSPPTKPPASSETPSSTQPPTRRILRQRASSRSLNGTPDHADAPTSASPPRSKASGGQGAPSGKRKVATKSKPVASATTSSTIITGAGTSRKGKERASTKDENAQSVNERLSMLMMQSMRATIGGREKPYERVPVWKEKEPTKRKVGRPKSSTPSKQSIALAARRKAKQRVKATRKAAKVLEEEDELYEDVDELDGSEPDQSATPQKDKGKGKSKEKSKDKSNASKKYMTSGLYCQDANVQSPYKLVNKVLGQASSSRTSKRKGGKDSQLSNAKKASGPSSLTFPPLPYDHGYDHFFGKEHDFVLPFNIHKEAANGALNDKKKPAPYQKIRGNVFPERPRVTAERAVCRCDPESGCGDNCINRIMSYICGKDCPCGERCTNRSLSKRPMAETKVKYTGSRGFGLFAMQDIKEGDFVTDYRGEVISLNTFQERLESEYAGQKNFYALAYDQAEVIDSGMRGNDARFINHGCDPNLDVRKYQTLGDGFEEFEIGMWALRDIKKGEELFYNYNFDWFGEAKNSLSAQCRCGASNCIGVLGRKNDRQSVALEVESKKAAEEARNAAKSQRGRKAARKLTKKTTVKFSGAVDRAKQAVLARSTKVSARATSAANGASSEPQEVGGEETPGQNRAQGPDVEAGTPDERTVASERERDDTTPEVSDEIEVHGSEADWLDITMDIDMATALDEASDSSRDSRSPGQQAGFEIIGGTSSRPNDSATTGAALAPFTRSSSLPLHLADSTLPALRDPSKTIPRSALINPPSPSYRVDPNGPSALTASTQDSAIMHPSPSEGPSTSSSIDDAPAERPQTKAEIAAAKRKSGWANWLRKIASEKPRTLEEWHEERMKRRRGIAWMNMMIAEFGVAPSPVPVTIQAYSDGRKPAGSVGSFANTLAAQGHGPGPEGVRNLGGPKNAYRSDNWKKTKEEQMKYVRLTTGSETSSPGTPSRMDITSPSVDSTPVLNASSFGTPAPSEDIPEYESNKRRRTGSSRLLAPPSNASGFMALPANARTSASASPNASRQGASHDEGVQAQSRSPFDAVSSPEQHPRPYSQPSWRAVPAGSRSVPTNAAPAAPAHGQRSVPAHTPRRSNDVQPFSNGYRPAESAISGTPTPASLPTDRVIDSTGDREVSQQAKRPYWRVAPNTPESRKDQRNANAAKIDEPPRPIARPAVQPESAAHKTPEHVMLPLRIAAPAAPRSVPSNFAPNGPADTPFTVRPLTYSSMAKPSESRSSSGRVQATPVVRRDESAPLAHPQDLPAHRSVDAPSPASASASPASRTATAKKQAIQKRNGAPMGWVYTYEPVQSSATRMGEEEVVANLPRSARRARQSLAKDEAARVEV